MFVFLTMDLGGEACMEGHFKKQLYEPRVMAISHCSSRDIGHSSGKSAGNFLCGCTSCDWWVVLLLRGDICPTVCVQHSHDWILTCAPDEIWGRFNGRN